MLICSNCGGTQFGVFEVLWPELSAAWQLSAEEIAYVNDQQGRHCKSCGANLRAMALGDALRRVFGTERCVREYVGAPPDRPPRILDVNGIPAVSDTLAGLPGYVRADYPTVDLHQLPYADGSFDLVVHSDTLEHVGHPIRALEECRRVLTPGGHLCFTIPVIVGRLSRSRAGLAASHHGSPGTEADDFLVHTEFGADAWTFPLRAGFTDVSVVQIDYPSALAFICRAPGIKPQPAGASSQPSSVGDVDVYDQDGLRSIHNHEFMSDPAFQRAYARGVAAVGADYRWHWRVHVGLWAASCASRIDGDFVECGVNRGFLSSAIMALLDWDRTGKTFFLLDTFTGIDERLVSPEEMSDGMLGRNAQHLSSGFYTTEVDTVRRNFAEWHNVKIVVGSIPDTLSDVTSSTIAFLHLDLNCSLPEVAAAEALWDRISPGGIILLDDYAYAGYRSQKLAMDRFAESRKVSILSLPTGQGLIVKPAC